jgi:hypothetical protein
MEEIINKVANSVLEVFDLELLSSGLRAQIDISQWLLEGFYYAKRLSRGA